MRIEGDAPKVDVAILTIKIEEFEAVLSTLPDCIGHYEASSHRHYSLHWVDVGGGLRYLVAVARQVEQGTGEAQDLTRDVIADLAPKIILVVGIAGAIPSADFTLGDVIVSTRILDYTLEARKDGTSDYAIAGGPMARTIEGAVAHLSARVRELGDWTAGLPPRPVVDLNHLSFCGPDEWTSRVRDCMQRHFSQSPRSAPIFLSGPIGSSDRLIKDPQLIMDWLHTARGILAVEMESAGAYRAARERCPMLAIRGISDIVGLARDQAWVPYACATAAAFARALLRTRPVLGWDICEAESLRRPKQEKPECQPHEAPTDLANLLTTKLLAGRPSLSLQGLRVLVVDNEESLRSLLKRMLQRCGAETQVACDGLEALRLFSAARPDLILADIVMPGLGGFVLARAVHAMDPSFPIVFMSGYPDSLADPMAKKHACGILEKPLSFESLRFCLESAMADDFRLKAPLVWPDADEVVHACNQCQKVISKFLKESNPNQVFETLLRHSLMERIHACAMKARAGQPGMPLLASLHNQITTIQSITEKIRFGMSLPFTDYVVRVCTDLSEGASHLRFETSVEANIDRLLGREVKALLTMAAALLIEHAKAALMGHGTIRVSARQQASTNMLLFKVSANRGSSSHSVAGQPGEGQAVMKVTQGDIGFELIRALALRMQGTLRLDNHDAAAALGRAVFVVEAPVHDIGPTSTARFGCRARSSRTGSCSRFSIGSRRKVARTS